METCTIPGTRNGCREAPSGGSGSAVASGQAALALGSDTGGSVRIPSALCGLVGLKPTYGLLSLYGLTPLAWSMDHPGPMVRSVEDCALAMDVLAGHDPKDPVSARVSSSNYGEALKTSPGTCNGRCAQADFRVADAPRGGTSLSKHPEATIRTGNGHPGSELAPAPPSSRHVR